MTVYIIFRLHVPSLTERERRVGISVLSCSYTVYLQHSKQAHSLIPGGAQYIQKDW